MHSPDRRVRRNYKQQYVVLHNVYCSWMGAPFILYVRRVVNPWGWNIKWIIEWCSMKAMSDLSWDIADLFRTGFEAILWAQTSFWSAWIETVGAGHQRYHKCCFVMYTASIKLCFVPQSAGVSIKPVRKVEGTKRAWCVKGRFDPFSFFRCVTVFIKKGLWRYQLTVKWKGLEILSSHLPDQLHGAGG